MPLFRLYFTYFSTRTSGYASQNEARLNKKLIIFDIKTEV